MALTAAASDVEKDFSAFHDKALGGEPVRVTQAGRETVYIVSAEAFHALKQRERHAIDAADLDAAELRAIKAADIPAEHRYSLDDEA